MIKINLLPVRAAKKREFGQQLALLFGLLVAATLIGNYLWYRSVDEGLAQVNRQIGATRNQITQLEKTIGEVKTITQDKKALEDKLKVLDTLKKGRTGPVKVLDEMSSIIPPRVWIGEYNEQAGAVTIRGFAAAYDDLSTFAQKLKSSKYFHDVTIRKASQKTVDRLTIAEAEGHLGAGQFPTGSMGPKIEAAIQFVRASGKEVLITDVEHLRDATACSSTTFWRMVSASAASGSRFSTSVRGPISNSSARGARLGEGHAQPTATRADVNVRPSSGVSIQRANPRVGRSCT